MIANVFVLGFIILMALLWSKYGLFSALLHFIYVIIAGAVAFGLWEVTAEALLSVELLANNAWGTALALVFTITLLLLRIASDKFAKQNMHFLPQLDSAGGLIFGALSGIVTTGVLILGCFPYLHFSEAQPLNYGPYILSNGVPVERQNQDKEAIGGLWIPVDQWVNDLYMTLSDGAFSPINSNGTTLASTRVDLKVQASMYHTDADVLTKLPVPNEAYKITGVFTTNLSEIKIANNEISEYFKLREGFTKLVMVETTWQRMKQISDKDRIFRLYPTQASIVGDTNATSNEHVEYKPICFTSQVNANHYLTLIDDNGDVAWVISNDNKINFLFLTKDEFQAKHILVSNTRKSIDKISKDSASILKVLEYTPFNQASPQSQRPANEKLPRENNGVELTNQIGVTFNRSGQSLLTYSEYDRKGKKFYHLESGDTQFSLKEGIHKSVRGRNQIRTLTPSTKFVWVRTELDAKKAIGQFKEVLQNAQQNFRMELIEEGKSSIAPVGYLVLKKNRTVILKVGQEIKEAAELPWQSIESDDKIYLFFSVPVGTHIVKYNKAPGESLDIDLKAFPLSK